MNEISRTQLQRNESGFSQACFFAEHDDRDKIDFKAEFLNFTEVSLKI